MYAYVRGSLKMSKRTYIRAYMYVYPIYEYHVQRARAPRARG